MTARSRRFAIALFSASITAVAFAQAPAPALDVKMGLWEITSTVNLGGQMPFDTSKLAPEQKAQMEAAMKGAMGAHTSVEKTCMTKEKFEKSSFMTTTPGMNCKQTISTNTRSMLEASVACTGSGEMTMQMHLEAESSTAVKGTMKGTASAAGKTLTSDGTMSGKWLGADCGNTK